MSSNYPNSTSNSSSSSSGTSDRLGLFLSSIPLITRLLLFTNISIHIFIFLFSFSIGNYAISAENVLYQQEFYRIVTSAFVHVGLLHIGMNMSTLFQLGPDLERQFGSLQLFFMTIWSIFLTGIVYVFISWALFRMLNDTSQLYTSGVGYSGILFTYAVIESFHTTETTRSLFGMCNVPARVYPFILLVLLSVVIPGISFLGHLSGCLVGLLTVAGFNVFLPSQGFLQMIESMQCMNSIVRSSSYVTCTNYSLTHPSFTLGDLCNCATLKSSCSYCYMILRQLFETLYHVMNCQAVGRIIKTAVASLWPSSTQHSNSSSNSSSSSSNTSHRFNTSGSNGATTTSTNNTNTTRKGSTSMTDRRNMTKSITTNDDDDDDERDIELSSSSTTHHTLIRNPLQLGISSSSSSSSSSGMSGGMMIGTRGSYQPLKTTDNDSLTSSDNNTTNTHNTNNANNNQAAATTNSSSGNGGNKTKHEDTITL